MTASTVCPPPSHVLTAYLCVGRRKVAAVGGEGALGERMVAGVGEVVAGMSLTSGCVLSV